tara:strand:- start:13318 stop:13872 length:555 start_codon:yes stop_codon:yes gene_type:complete
MRFLKYLGVGLLVIIISLSLGVVVVQRVSDGPIEFLQGGPFQTGEVVKEPVTDWSFGELGNTQFELVGYGTSRRAGFIMLDGVAYMTCDLGFIWNRLEGMPKMVLNLIYVFKSWHLDAVEDGRARIRLDGKIYETQFTKVEDPELQEKLKLRIETIFREMFGELGPQPVNGPKDIWFFRIDSRV